MGLYLLLWFGLQLMQVVALIWLVQVIHVPAGIATLLLLAFNIAALVGLQVWSVLSNRHGRIKALGWGSSIWIAACLLSMTLAPLTASSVLSLIPVIGLIMLVGLGASTAYLIPWSLLPDAIDADQGKHAALRQWRKGHRKETGGNPNARSPAQCLNSSVPVGQHTPNLETHQGGDIEGKQEQCGNSSWNVDDLDEPNQGNHLHQLKAKPKQQIQP